MVSRKTFILGEHVSSCDALETLAHRCARARWHIGIGIQPMQYIDDLSIVERGSAHLLSCGVTLVDNDSIVNGFITFCLYGLSKYIVVKFFMDVYE